MLRKLIVLGLIACTLPVIASENIKVTSISPVVPLIKGLATNQLLRIEVCVSKKRHTIKLENMFCKLNVAGIKAIERIEVYSTGKDSQFSDQDKLASISPVSPSFNIPVTITLKPGIHYIWFSAKLKENADIDAKVEFHVKGLQGANSKKYAVTENSDSYVKRLGIAVRKANDEGVNTFRIPGIITTDKQTLIAVYDIRYQSAVDLPGNIDVGLNRSVDGGKSWEPMKVIMDMGEPHTNNGVGDPAILFDPVTNKIWVAALWSKGNRSIAGSKPGLSEDVTGQFVLVSSEDDGLTWSAPKSITAQVKNPAWNIFFNGPGNGIAMQDGKIVFAAQYWDGKSVPYSNIVYSEDHGITWKTEDGPKSKTTESQVIETQPGVLMLNMRDNRGAFRSVATTVDMGKTWVEHYTSYSALPDPVCMASFIKAGMDVNGKQKEVVFFGNNNSSSERNNFTIKASLDLAESWLAKNQLLIDERKSFGYSALTKIDNNTIGLFYEGVKDLYFVRIPVNEIVR
ncbi:sialidase family protein [Pedobacter arcticus]|uniref:sialidase family protein n=1 Tax=Pedobacter arcticus TaxID=752140 RepID=UPI001375A2A5|nr:sialidase family protein [Pedobacter arcticus]